MLTCFSMVNLMLGTFLSRKLKKFNKSLSLPETVKMSLTYLK